MEQRNRFYFKACPKCNGDMYLDSDAYGHFRKCLQCGRLFELGLNQHAADKSRKGKMAA